MKNYLLFLICMCVTSIYGQHFEWVNQLGGISQDSGEDVIVDDSGNVYSCGTFNTLIDVDPGPSVYTFSSFGQQDIFIVKTNAAGLLMWAKQIGGSQYDQVYALALDAVGNLIVTGTFIGAADMDPGVGVVNFTAFGDQDIFVTKLNAAGTYIWAKQFGGTLVDRAYDVETDDAGNIYLTGTFQGVSDFDPDAGTFYLSTTGDMDVFTLQLNANGNLKWANQIGGLGEDIAYNLALDNLGSVYTTGSFKYTVDFDAGTGTSTLTTLGSFDIFVLKTDTSGNFNWAKQIGGPVGGKGLSLVVDNTHNILFTGTFQGTLDFDPGIGTFNLSAVDMDDIFVCKLNASGNFMWAKGFGGNGFDTGFSLASDQNGNVYTVGYFSQTVDFDPGTGTYAFTSMGFDDMFMQKLDSNGNFVWAYQFGDSNFESMHNTYVDAYNTIYVVGAFTNTIDFDPEASVSTLSTSASSDAFVLKLNQCDTVLAPVNTSTPENLLVCNGATATLTATGTGTLYWYNAATGGTVLGIGNTFSTAVLTDSTTFFVKDSACALSSATVIGVIVKPPVNTNVTFASSVLSADIAGTILPEPSYQWLNCFDNSVLTGETNASFTPLSNGDYAVVVNYSGCVDTSTCVNVNTIGIAEQLLGHDVLVYPNPARHLVFVKTNEPITQLTLVNALGKIITCVSYSVPVENSIALNVGEFAKGPYTLCIATTKSLKTTHLILE